MYHFDARTCAVEVAITPPQLPDLPPVRYEQQQYRSFDGTPVSLTILRRADMAAGPSPTLLSAYGGFGVAMTPTYDPGMLAWVQAGGTYAVAGVRGGGDSGSEWHRAGTGAGKRASVSDVIAAGEHLIEGGWTAPGRLAAVGGSNGACSSRRR